MYSKYDASGKEGLYDYLRGSCGGYKISPAQIIQNDVTPERVLKFIELCKKNMEVTVRINPKITEGQKNSFLISYFYQEKIYERRATEKYYLDG